MAATIHHEIKMTSEGDGWQLRRDRSFPCSLQDIHLVKDRSQNDHINPVCTSDVLRTVKLAVSAQPQAAELQKGSEKVVQEGALHAGIASYVAILKACAKTRDFPRGIKIHEEILQRGFLETCFAALVSMYVKCGALTKAEEMLLQNNGNVYSWTELIAAYARQNQGQHALLCFETMQTKGLAPDTITFLSILKACGSIKAFNKGEQLHREIVREGLLVSNVMLGTALVDMYAKCGSLAKAEQLLMELSSRDVISWSALIQGFAQQGLGLEALRCYDEMQQEGLFPDAVTFSCILKACGAIGAVDKGRLIHNMIARRGLLRDNVVLGTALVDMYAKCGDLPQAQQVLSELPFRDVIAWNALIAGYAQMDQGEQTLQCYEQMQREGLSPNAMTYTSILKVYGNLGAVDRGEKLHDQLASECLLQNDIQLGSALVDMYVKCGALTKAQQVLEGLPARNVVSWSTLIAGYAEQGQGEQAFECYEKMKLDGLSPDSITFIAVLKACGSIGAADRGRKIHGQVAREGLLRNSIELGNALVDMYAKCGVVSKAQEVLENLHTRDVVSWNSLITGYARHGQGEQAVSCLDQMQSEGLSPNAVTFLCVLTACNHLGLVQDGHMHFVNMTTKHGIQPEAGHFACMVDLFGRAGHLDKAVRIIQLTPSSGYFAIWFALLGACRNCENVTAGQWAFDHSLDIDEGDAASYVHMANIYASASMQADAGFLRPLQTRKQE